MTASLSHCCSFLPWRSPNVLRRRSFFNAPRCCSGSGAQSFSRKSARYLLPLCATFLISTDGLCNQAFCEDQSSANAMVSSGSSVFDPLSRKEKQASRYFEDRVSEAIALLEKARQAQAQADFQQAFFFFTQIIENYGDLALTEYARVGRAITLYEVGDKEEAFVELEDVSLSLKGYPEIHAALAAALYADKQSPISAEKQFTIATLLDPHYTDVSYVKYTKHWPPSLVRSLERFINFQ